MQRTKLSYVPLCSAMIMVAIHVNSTGGMDPLLERLARIIRALRPLQVAYKTAGSVEALSPDLLALAQECQALVDEDAPGPMPALRHLVEDHQDDAPDIERHITLYNDGCPVIAAALPVKFGDEELGSLEEVVASQRQLLDGMTQPQLQPQVEECRQATLQVGLDMAQVNSDGLPSLFWPASAPTRFIFRLAFLVWVRSVAVCDVENESGRGCQCNSLDSDHQDVDQVFCCSSRSRPSHMAPS